MSRGFSFIMLLALGIAAFLLYQLSYEVQRLEDELVELNRSLGQERETIGVLQAEWSYLSRPEALQEKADKFLGMKPATAKQIVRLEDLPWRQERVAPQQAATLLSSLPLQSAPAKPAPVPAAEILKPAAEAIAAIPPSALPAAAPVLPASVTAEQVAAPVSAVAPVSVAAKAAPKGAPPAAPKPAAASDVDADVAAVLGAMRNATRKEKVP